MAAPRNFKGLRYTITERTHPGHIDATLSEIYLEITDSVACDVIQEIQNRVGDKGLRHILRSPVAERVFWVELSQAQRNAFLKAIRAWAARERKSGDRGQADGWEWDGSSLKAEELPNIRSKLQTWAEKWHVESLLQDTGAVLAPLLDFEPEWGDETVEDLVLARPDPDSKLVGRERIAAKEAARRYLSEQARIKSVANIVSERTPLYDDAPYRAYLEQLESMIRANHARVTPRSAIVTMSDDPPRLKLFFAVGDDETAHGNVTETVELLFMDGDLRIGRHSSSPALGAYACEIAADILTNKKHPLHNEFRTATERSSWDRFVSKLTDEQQEINSANVRLTWRVSSADPIDIQPAVQKRGARGWSKGKVISMADVENDFPVLAYQDEAVMRALNCDWDHNGGSAKNIFAALDALSEHPLVFSAADPTQRVRIDHEPLTVIVRKDEIDYTLELRIADQAIDAEELRNQSAVIRYIDDKFRLVELAPATQRFIRALASYPARLPEPVAKRIVHAMSKLEPGVRVVVPALEIASDQEAESRPLVRIEKLSGHYRFRVRVRPLAEGAVYEPGRGPSRAFGLVDGRWTIADRNFEKEERSASEVNNTVGLNHLRRGSDQAGEYYDGDELEQVLRVVHALGAHQIETEWLSDSEVNVVSGGQSSMKLRAFSSERWFAVEGEVQVSGEMVALSALVDAISNGNEFVEVGKGKFARIEDDIRQQLEALSDRAYSTDEGLAIGRAQLVDVVSEGNIEIELDSAGKAAVESFRQLATFSATLPSGFKGELRAYQHDGYQWLARLARTGLGAVLADEMGLGKTIQALALILDRAPEGPSLVVAPTSLIDQWTSESNKFSPELNVLQYHAPDRAKQLDKLGPYTVLVTSYDIMRRDTDLLAEHSFQVVVYDEAQFLKNSRSSRAKAARALRAEFSLASTGTPLENSLEELWSLFNLVQPGLLGPGRDFAKRFVQPIEQHGDNARLKRLRKRIAPFVLRRKKIDVLPELPPRTMSERFIELGNEARALYERERVQAVQSLTSKRGRNQIRVLEKLMRLRQIACDPALVYPEFSRASAKTKALLDLVDTLKAGGHRALVFSQFTSYLARVRHELDRRDTNYLYLDGKTPTAQRAVLTKRWQDSEIPLFLISLRAGGTGLNLSAADYVIHLDPWWNPAVENQASDRAHRIGQTKKVTIVRLVAAGTVEERVLELQQRKAALAESALENEIEIEKLSMEALIGLMQEGQVEYDAALDDLDGAGGSNKPKQKTSQLESTL